VADGAQTTLDLETPLAAPLANAGCPHLAILLDSIEDVPAALASFYALGLRRNGWLFHHSLPGKAEADRRMLSSAGLDVAELERTGRLEVCEVPITKPPEEWAQPYVPIVERQLGHGYDAVWWSRFPVGAEDESLFARALEYDRHWDACFHGRPSVSLCVYIVGDLSAADRGRRADGLRTMHDATLVPEPGGALRALDRTPA
jgi:hypothetical protein